MPSEYIRFELIEEKPKTSVYEVINIKHDVDIGIIRWYGAWRKYCFFPEDGTLFDNTCLTAISEFIQQLMEERKK